MYDFDIDITPQKKSVRIGQDVYSLVLERCWWQAFEDACPNQVTRKDWLMEWIQDARDRGCNRQALIRYRIHQLVLDARPEPGPDPGQVLLDRIAAMRKRKVSWRQVAIRLNDETVGRGQWTEESVRSFYYTNRSAEG